MLCCGQANAREPRIKKLSILTDPDTESSQTVATISKYITEVLEKDEGRPSKICIILNPIGGRATAKVDYEKVVLPILNMSSIEIVHYFETERENHAYDIAQMLDVKSINAIICVGGDGLISEVVNGLLSRDDADEVKKCPLGVIPAGSQNALAVSVAGTASAMWHTLCIIVGLRQPLDIMKIHDIDSGAVRYALSMVSFGILGDITSDSQSKRWLGPLRYQVSAVKKWMSMKHYKVVVSIIPESEETDDVDIQANDHRWHVLNGNSVFMLCCFNISGANAQMPAQVVAHPDDGYMSLLIWRESNRTRVLEYMWKMQHGQHYDLDYLVFTKAKAVKIEPPIGASITSSISPVNIDGEVIDPARLIISVMPQRVSLLMGQI